MRYRIQIQPMLGATLCVVTSIHEYGGSLSSDSKMYTLEDHAPYHGGLVEILGELQRLIGETTP